MLGELESARVKGLTFVEFQNEVIKLVKHYISDSYNKYPVLRENGIDKEEIETVVYNSLYNRKDINELSNIERYFIKASEMSDPSKLYGDDTKYLVAIIRKVVGTTFGWLSRGILRKGQQPTLSFEGCMFDKYIGVEDKYDKLHYEDLLKQVPQVYYPYVIELNGKRKKLSSRLILDLIVSGYKSKDLASIIYSDKTNECITISYFNRIRNEVIHIARESLKDFT